MKAPDQSLQVDPSRSLTPIIKVVGDYCNLRCSYCFYSRKDQSKRRVMPDGVLDSFLRQHLGFFNGTCCFVWHGGEPLLAGLGFFERVVELQRRYARPGQRMINTIQTNATLLTDRWAEFFKNHDFHVGVSLDGDGATHDQFRQLHGGAGSYRRVRRGIETLRRHGMSFGIVQVLTSASAAKVRETFQFLAKDVGARHWSMNPFVDFDGYSCARGDSLDNGQWRDAVMACIDEWLKHGDRDLAIREIENLVSGVMGRRSRACSYNGACERYYCVNWDGGVYPCDNFTNDPTMQYGHLGSEQLMDILGGMRRQEVLARMTARPAACASCEWWQACHNGCPSHRVGGIEGKLAFCSARRELFRHTKSLIERFRFARNSTVNPEKP